MRPTGHPTPPAFDPAQPPIGGMEPLSPKRRRESVENDAYGAFIRRAIIAYGRRVGDGAVDDLAALVELRDVVDDAIADAVRALRSAPHEHSWSRIASVLGITKQAAMQRWPDAGGTRRRGGQPARLR